MTDTDDDPGPPRPDDFTDLLRLLIERTVTLSVRCAALQALLDARGVVATAALDAAQTALRRQWQVDPVGLSDAAFVATLRRVLHVPADGPPPGDAP